VSESGSRRRASARVFEFCSCLVDLVIGIRRNRGGGHRLAAAGERLVGLVSKDFVQVGDRGADFGERRRGEGADCETGDGGRRLVASEPVQKSGEDSQWDVDRGGVARIVEDADCQSGVIECGHRVAVFGLKSCQKLRRG